MILQDVLDSPALQIGLIHSRTLADWESTHPLIKIMRQAIPTDWFNPAIASFSEAYADIDLSQADVIDAETRLRRFASFLMRAFPELKDSQGIIESEVVTLTNFAGAAIDALQLKTAPSRLMLKKDSHLPIAGSVKARGGVYEVLYHAEQLALKHKIITTNSDYSELNSEENRAFFKHYKIAVGSTGNLGMSIGIAAARLGFQTTVHMSADAREWKKERLRANGVSVIEYEGDYGEAVAQGRKEADQDPFCHFIDDENSRTLFLGYAVAGARLKAQFDQQGIHISTERPLFVYLPCGVGGGPGGISFGLKLAFGDNVHCIFAEPTQSPCMLLGVYSGLHDEISVRDIGLSNQTAADGLAVGTASGFVGKSMQRMIDGYYTLSDDEMFQCLALMQQSEGIKLEPSALAGALGFERVLGQSALPYRKRLSLDEATLSNAIHLIWATGGGMVPEEEYGDYLNKGQSLLKS